MSKIYNNETNENNRENDNNHENDPVAPASLFSSPPSRDALIGRLTDYLASCRSEEAGGAGKARGGRIPNVAGFCRFCGIGVEEFDALQNDYPDLHGALCAILEDEALNSDLSATVLSIYLKMRLGYAEGGARHPQGTSFAAPGGQLKIIFDHDGYADGE